MNWDMYTLYDGAEGNLTAEKMVIRNHPVCHRFYGEVVHPCQYWETDQGMKQSFLYLVSLISSSLGYMRCKYWLKYLYRIGYN